MSVFRLFYNDFDSTELHNILAHVGFKYNISHVDSLVQLVREVSENSDKEWKILDQMTSSNSVVSEMFGNEKKQKYWNSWIKAGKVLVQGDFDLIPELIEKELPHYKFMYLFGENQKDYYELLQGLAGVLSFNEARERNQEGRIKTILDLSLKEELGLIYKQIQ